ncbi:hypothetical protein PENTCL1PPCAC_27529 [Pristionchus entomophagus]|uniref:Uncharacterized protein n=1 Tax=Pristionchus entomophagus TaxID=358040 RepID=A0AAV5UH63_9BILA|nr:hypothetical protein PENTCL1PPCAC_27529 [Pristionchus entomophagus]
MASAKCRRIFDRPKIVRMFTVSSPSGGGNDLPVVMREDEEEKKREEDSVSRVNSISILATTSTQSDLLLHERWTNKKTARSHFISLITALYALILIMFSLVVEVSPAWKTADYVTESIFHGYMYGMGIIFLCFIYTFVLYPNSINSLARAISRRKCQDTSWQIPSPMHTGEGAGSLYLRLVFGCMGLVLYGLEIFLCIDSDGCSNGHVSDLLFSTVFLFFQMHFIFCNSKLTVSRFKVVCKIGFIHLAATNIWTWFRFVTFKQQAKIEKKMAHQASSSSSLSSSEEYYKDEIFDIISKSVSAVTESMISTTTVKSKTLPSIKYFGDIATFFTTCLVEFALIAAAVMLIIWRSIDREEEHHVKTFESTGKRNSSSTGLFGGIVFLIAACIAMGVYVVFDDLHSCDKARLVFGIFDTCMFVVTLLACLVGLWRMRLLSFAEHKSGEVLDEILLFIGLIGELLFCCCEIDVFITPRAGFKQMPVYVFIMYIFRLIQVTVQTVFILMSFRLHGNPSSRASPGKQFVTFLLVANVTLFVFHVYEGMKKGFGYEMHGDSAYTIIIYAVTPLIVFYRFHSSVCLAEIWKHAYSKKESRSGSLTSISIASTTSTSVSRPQSLTEFVRV